MFSHSTVSHGVQHYITTTGSPVHAIDRRLLLDKITIAKNEFAETESLGTTNTIPWSHLEQLTLLNAVSTSSHSNIKVFILDELLSTKYVFVRHRTPLQRPYDGPYEVILPGSTSNTNTSRSGRVKQPDRYGAE